MDRIRQEFSVTYRYQVLFVEGFCEPSCPALAEALPGRRRLLAVFDAGMARCHPDLADKLQAYCRHWGIDLAGPPLLVPGGESAKNDPRVVGTLLAAIDLHGLCRHSTVLAVGGGAVLDAAGYAAAIAHRGLALIRAPTTVLAQNDAGIGVKNGVNALGKKNFIGTFQAPLAVINDSRFLSTLNQRDWRAGMAEAVKVALIRDAAFFAAIEGDARALAARQAAPMGRLIRRCAELHLDHICRGGDPFEAGSARPLDFGHWAAHRLEALSGYRLRHGEAVAIGIALDCLYSALDSRLPEAGAERVLQVLEILGFDLWVPELELESLFEGIDQFREHLGGELTVTLLAAIGRGAEVHALDTGRYRAAIARLRQRPSTLALVA